MKSEEFEKLMILGMLDQEEERDVLRPERRRSGGPLRQAQAEEKRHHPLETLLERLRGRRENR